MSTLLVHCRSRSISEVSDIEPYSSHISVSTSGSSSSMEEKMELDYEHKVAAITRSQSEISDSVDSRSDSHVDAMTTVPCLQRSPKEPYRPKECDFVLFGGGPSSIPPLLYFNNFETYFTSFRSQSELGGVVSEKCNSFRRFYFGDPTQSLILRGRDPQKTLTSLVTVASKYGTFDNLSKWTRRYYGYIQLCSSLFNKSLDDCIEMIYLEKVTELSIDSKRLVWCGHPAVQDFFLVEKDFSISNNFRFSILSLNSNEKGTDSSENEVKDITLIGQISNKIWTLEQLLLLQQDGLEIEDLGARHGDFHYLQIFFDEWQTDLSFTKCLRKNITDDSGNSGDPESESSVIKPSQFFIDRSGFSYPTPFSNELLAQLNLDFISLVLEVLNSVDRLNELEEVLKSVLERYISRHDPGPDSYKRERNFVVIGAGRAAGEISRRLYHDVIHSSSLVLLTKLYQDRRDIRLETLQKAEKKYQHEIRRRRKNVIAIDHKLLNDPGSSYDAKKLVETRAYITFMKEITAHHIAPKISETAFVYYSILRQTLIDLNTPHAKELAKYLGDLLEGQTRLHPGDSHVFILLQTKTRYVEFWDAEVNDRIATVFKNEPYELLPIGGAIHASLPNEGVVSANFLSFPSGAKDEADFEYQLTRIHDSHFRRENLCFIEAIGKDVIEQLRHARRELYT